MEWIKRLAEYTSYFGAILFLLGTGWTAHSLWHRHEHDKLKSKVSELEKELLEAKAVQKVTVNIKNLTSDEFEHHNKELE